LSYTSWQLIAVLPREPPPVCGLANRQHCATASRHRRLVPPQRFTHLPNGNVPRMPAS